MMRNRCHMVMLVATLMLVFSACSKVRVHEFPGENPVDPTIVNATIRIKPCEAYSFREGTFAPVYTESYFTEPAKSLRYILEVAVDESFSQEIIYREVITATPDQLQNEIARTLRLHALNYKVNVWQDLTDPSDPLSDVWYKTNPLTAIKIAEAPLYVGGHDSKQASTTNDKFSLVQYANDWNVNVDIPIQLIRPQSKYILVSTDVAKFVKSYNANYSQHGEMTAEEIFEQCTMKVLYNGFLPTGYNVYSGLLNDSQGGYRYDFDVTLINDNQAIVAFDYVLTGPNDTAVNVGLQIFDCYGVLVNSVNTVNIPLSRNKITVIYGEYLTREYGGGVGIDPGFDGEFNLYI